MLSVEEIAGIGDSLSTVNGLTVEKQEFVRKTFAQGYSQQMWVTLGFSALVVITSLLMWERKLRRMQVHDNVVEQR